MSATIKDNGDVYVDDDLIGRLEGLKFTADTSAGSLEASALNAAAAKAVAPEVDRRLTSICSGTHAIFTLSDTGEILWGGKAVGRIAKSGSVFTPDAELIGGELGKPALQNMASERMREFLRAEVMTHLGSLKGLKDLGAAEDTLPSAKGFAFILLENNGAIERRDHLQTVRDLDQDARRQLRAIGVTFGHYNVYLNDLTKPKPAKLLSLLVAYGAGGDRKPWIPFAGVTSIANEGELASTHYSEQALKLAGYRAVGTRIIRFDILNRLSFLIRDAQEAYKQTKLPEARGHKFQVAPEMLALLGSSYEDVRAVLKELGYASNVEAESLTRPVEPEVPTAEVKDVPAEVAKAVEAAITPVEQIESAPVKPDRPASPAPEDVKAAVETAVATTPPAPAPRKSKPKRVLTVYQPRVETETGEMVLQENLEYWYFPARGQKGFKPKGGKPNQGGQRQNYRSKGKSDFKPKAKRDGKRSERPPSKKQIENSPFAALAALQGKKD